MTSVVVPQTMLSVFHAPCAFNSERVIFRVGGRASPKTVPRKV